MGTKHASRTARLGAYVAAAAAIPTADADVIIGDDLGLTATDGSPSLVDFGPGFGQLFRFDVAWTRIYTSDYSFAWVASYGAASVRFNATNTGGWTAASVLGYAAGYRIGMVPQRLALEGAPIGPGDPDWIPLDAAQRLNFQRLNDFGIHQAWGPWVSDPYLSGSFRWSVRGAIGVRITQDAGATHTYAWLDVETLGWFDATLVVHGWGLQTTPGVPIETPAPTVAGLALLALGAAGVRRHRRLDA